MNHLRIANVRFVDSLMCIKIDVKSILELSKPMDKKTEPSLIILFGISSGLSELSETTGSGCENVGDDQKNLTDSPTRRSYPA